MLHLKSYVGSIVLAGLLLQGCGSDTTESTATSSTVETLSAADAQTAATLTALTDTVNSFDGTESDAEIKATFDALKIKLLTAQNDTTTATAIQSAGILTGLTDTLTNGLVNALDTSVGDAVTTATFDVVLNSEGVTVAMIDLARGSETLSEIMVNSIEADWSLAEKMCPMLRDSTEFGEKFTALAEEQDVVGRFFFERIDANMYGCLTDAMLLSNNDAVHDESVTHSTNGYMGLLMDRYATDYFVTPDSTTTGLTAGGAETSDVRRNDKFVSLLLDTGALVDYNATTKIFTGHGDGNELINEKFFYSLFKTPVTTEYFVSAMDKVKDADAENNTATLTMLMDNIFLGTPNGTGETDTTQGYLNIIAIGSAMYDGIYGEADENGVRTGDYGFASYSGAFIGFAGLIPGDRYIPYGKAFINAGYEYAKYHGIGVWDGVSEAAQTVWNNFTTTDATAAASAARSGGNGLSSDWYGDIRTLLYTAYDNFEVSINWLALYDSVINSDKSIVTEITEQLNGLQDEGNKAYRTVIDGRDENNNTVYPTTITNSILTADDNNIVYGFHGLLELAIREDMVNTGLSADMTEAENNFSLPLFGDITMSFAYNTAKDGVKAYVSNIDADWIADLSTNTLIRDYFYPSADNVYLPNWLLAIDWLTVPSNYTNSSVANYDLSFDFNSGYLDIYVVTTNADLLNSIDLPTAVDPLKTITMTKVDMGTDTIIVVDENGLNADGLNVYKIRVVSPEDVEAVLAYFGGLQDSALSAIGIDSSNAANVDTTE